jgi:hypothetical protein
MTVVLQSGGTSSPGATGCLGSYTFTDVMTVVNDMTHQVPTAISQVYVCDKINSIVHLYWPWRWTKYTISPITALNGIQDYANVPLDFYQILAGRINRTDVTPAQIQPIKVVGHLEPEVQRQGSINTVQCVSFEPTINSFRLDIPLEVSGTTVYTISLDYQNQPTKVSALAQAICPPDQYFNVFVEGVLWGIYRLADDPRTGSVTINRAGDKQYSGQLSVFMDALETMKRNEDSGEALNNRYPEEPLGWTRTGNVSIFPTI